MQAETFKRRLHAVAVIDVAGYSALMGVAESITHSRVNELFEKIVKPLVLAEGGRLIERAGDALLVIFDSSTQAVRCAVAVQRALASGTPASGSAPLRLRIGIHVGDIIVDGDEIAGDDVNIAARLQSIAAPGAIVVSAAVREQLHEDFGVPFDDLGKVALKNIARPVHAFQLEPVALPRSRFRRATALAASFSRRSRAAGVLLLGVAALGLAFAWLQRQRTPGGPEPMSVAVSAFAVQTPVDPHSVAEIADSIRRGLASTPWLRVAAGEPASALPASAGSMSAIGRDVGVRYVVTGKVDRRTGGLGVDINLVDTAKSTASWTTRVEAGESVEKPAALGAAAVVLLREAIYDAETRRLLDSGAAPSTPMEFKMLGDLATDTHFLALEQERKARVLYEGALRLDPDFVPGLISVGYTLISELDLEPTVDRDSVLSRLDQLSKRSVTRDPSAPSWQFRSEVLARHWRWDAALDASDKALAGDPARAFAYSQRASVLLRMGRPEEAVSTVEVALSKAEQRSGYAWFQKCRAEMALGRYPAAADSCQKAVAREEWWLQHAYLLAAYEMMGDALNVAAERATLKRVYPDLSIERLRALRLSNVPAFEGQIEQCLYRGLRRAGIPERG